MHNLARLLLSVAVILTFSSARVAGGQDVAGTVVGPDGKPIANAPVRLLYCEYGTFPSGRLAGETASDGEGRFRFSKAFVWADKNSPGLWLPQYQVISSPPGMGIGYIALRRGDQSDGFQLDIAPREVRTVTVVDEEGRPLSGARVWIYHSRPRPPMSLDPRRSLGMSTDLDLGDLTDINGSVSVVVPPGYDTVVAARAPGYAMGSGTDRVTLTRGAVISGRVLDPEGNAVAEARVGCAFAGAVTDAHGRFELRDVAVRAGSADGNSEEADAGNATLSASLWKGGASWAGEVTLRIRPAEAVQQDITVQRRVRLSGRVTDLDSGAPVGGMTLRLIENGPGYEVVETSEAGEFTFDVRPGTSGFVTIDPTRVNDHLVDDEETWSLYELTNLVADKTDVKIAVKLRKLAPLAGKVVDAKGQPVANAMVVAHPNLRAETTDADGRFLFKAAPTDSTGEIAVFTSRLGGVAFYAAGQAEITVLAQPLVSRECIVQTTEGEPARGLSLSLAKQSAQGKSLFFYWHEPTVTDGKGRCRFDKLIVDGAYIAYWTGGIYDVGTAPLNTPPEREPIRLTVPMYNKQFDVMVTNLADQPLSGARIALEGERALSLDATLTVKSLRSDGEGRLRLQSLRAGPITFTISCDGYREHHASASVVDGIYKAVLTKLDEQSEP